MYIMIKMVRDCVRTSVPNGHLLVCMPTGVGEGVPYLSDGPFHHGPAGQRGSVDLLIVVAGV